MKGPGMRLELDVRRRWRCPQCGAVRRTSGAETTLACDVCTEHPLMVLIDGERRALHLKPELDLVIPLHPDDVDAPPFIPPSLMQEAEPVETAPMNRAGVGSPVDRSESDARKRSPPKRGRRKPQERAANPASVQGAIENATAVRPPRESTPVLEPDAFGDGVLDVK